MPIYQIDIQKNMGTEYWTNVYHVEADDLSAAKALGGIIITAEKGIHGTLVNFVSYRTAPYPGPSEGSVQPIGGTGLATIDNYLPLFNVARVDFPTTVGRPSRKYYRVPVAEATQTNGVFDSTFRTAFQAQLNTLFGAMPPGSLVDVDGQPLGGAIVNPNVGMRQLRRGSKRRLLPVIPVE